MHAVKRAAAAPLLPGHAMPCYYTPFAAAKRPTLHDIFAHAWTWDLVLRVTGLRVES